MFGRRRLEAALLEAGLINKAQFETVFDEHRASGRRISKILIEKGYISEDSLLSVMEEQFNVPRVNLDRCSINPAVAGYIPAETAMRHCVIPLAKKEGQITLAMADPLDLDAIDNVAMLTGAEINPVAARQSSVNYLITQLYSMNDPAGEASSPAEIEENNSTGASRVAGLVEQDHDQQIDEAPVIRIVNSLIERAIEEGASDIHLEPSDQNLRIRLRLDGVLHDLTAIPKHSRARVVSRVKIMANLDIAERRLSQDGNIEWKGSRGGISLRVSTLPTVRGEKVVIRLLEKDKIVLPLEKLGFTKSNYNNFLGLLLNQSGLLLVTGPTGCGKTTTLYSALHYLNRPEDNIITVEDPVEYRLKGINQVQVNTRINRSFSVALRSILRQDPNVIMVGEIRDLETAKMTIQSAFTGHLVLSTLHTNHAAGAVTRLIDIGLENYLVTASLVGVVAQRLVRKICENCAQEYSLADDQKLFYRRYFQKEPPRKLFRGGKCSSCSNTGYRGRTSIQEVLILNRELQELILRGVTAEGLQNKAVEQGMVPLVQDGLRCIEEGLTTVDEVIRATFNSIIDQGFLRYEDRAALMARLQGDNSGAGSYSEFQ